MRYHFSWLLAVVLLLTACSSHQVTNRINSSDKLAAKFGFTKKLIKADEFLITTYQRINNPELPYVFYIEGDGLAFIGRYQISDNPTPIEQVVLKLAALDQRPNIIYIARPCQLTPVEANPICNQAYWTNLRMSEQVVKSLDKVIESINNKQPFSLVGYSGGGGIAVLIAGRNKLVKDVLTVAGNLDHVSFNKYHNTKPMLGSLNPVDYAKSVKHIPQLHIASNNDKIVPPFISGEFVRASNFSPCVHIRVFDNPTHSKAWDAIWRDILAIPINCSTAP